MLGCASGSRRLLDASRRVCGIAAKQEFLAARSIEIRHFLVDFPFREKVFRAEH